MAVTLILIISEHSFSEKKSNYSQKYPWAFHANVLKHLGGR